MSKPSDGKAGSPGPRSHPPMVSRSWHRTTPIGGGGALSLATTGTGRQVFLTMNGKRPALWRAVAQADNGLDSLVQSWRHKPRRSNAAASCSQVVRRSHGAS